MHNCCSVPDKTEGLCPECGKKGKKVQRTTMEHLVQPSLVSEIAPEQYFFCESPSCKAVYFSSPGKRIFHKQDLPVRVGLKETEDPVPICYCFGYTQKMAWDEIHETGKTQVPSKIKAEIQAGNCACEIKNPSGRCCLGNVDQVVREGVQNLEQQLAVGGVKRSYSLNP